MDQDRFDQLARALGAGRSRRGVLKALGGAALGALAGVAGAERAGANPPQKHCKFQGYNCGSNADCCTLNCCNRTCCGDGQVCANGQCAFPTSTTPAPTTTTTPTPTTTPAPTTTTTTTPKPSLCTGVTCQPLDQCHVAGTCDPATGHCSNPLVADGTTCDDGNLCTTFDACFNGVCQAGAPVVCPLNTTCDPMSGCGCQAGATLCPGGCANTTSDNNHCGSCDNACPSGFFCSNGTCAPLCVKAGSTCQPSFSQCCDPTRGCGQHGDCFDGPDAFCC